MFKTFGLWTCGLALALSPCVLGATADTGSLAGTPNPDAANIKGEAGGQTIALTVRSSGFRGWLGGSLFFSCNCLGDF